VRLIQHLCRAWLLARRNNQIVTLTPTGDESTKVRCFPDGTLVIHYEDVLGQALALKAPQVLTLVKSTAAWKVEGAVSSVNKRIKTSKYKGVGFNRASGKWRATTCVGGRYTHLGSFDTEEQAREAYEAGTTQEVVQ
jgi:hypothetical protein